MHVIQAIDLRGYRLEHVRPMVNGLVKSHLAQVSFKYIEALE